MTMHSKQGQNQVGVMYGPRLENPELKFKKNLRD